MSYAVNEYVLGHANHELKRLISQSTFFGPLTEQVLRSAGLAPGMHVLDVGCGNGLVAFGALERGAGRVVFADISRPLLDECRSIAEGLGALERCEFVEAAADALVPVAYASVDVVTTRSVLIYVADKRAAFAEFFRVLRPGGRVSLFEPINTFGMEQRRREFFGLDLPGLAEAGAKLEAAYDEAAPESNPMVDFDERDLVEHAEAAGFFPIRLDLRLDVEPSEPRSWESFLNGSPNPNVPTFGEALGALTPGEAERMTAYMRPRVEQGLGRWRMGHAYLWATKPG